MFWLWNLFRLFAPKPGAAAPKQALLQILQTQEIFYCSAFTKNGAAATGEFWPSACDREPAVNERFSDSPKQVQEAARATKRQIVSAS
jgi:hypothetical protein